MSVHVFGIRHHGVGSARSLGAALEQLNPDCVLIEGPPDADELIPLVGEPDMQPPVAILVYDPAQPQKAAWYPFAVYSPEWIAMRYAVERGIDARFMDLPLKHALALEPEIPADSPIAQEPDERRGTARPAPTDDDSLPLALTPDADGLPDLQWRDPLGLLAELAGEPDGERWWNRVVEEAQNPTAVFAVIADAMAALREHAPMRAPWGERLESLREAWMRKTIRAAEKQYGRVAVVCGAWHVPALTAPVKASADNDLLKGLPSTKTQATFSPWTYSRLAVESGYGAGVISPGWYHHLWETPAADVPARWLSRVAALLRGEGLLASTAQVIDAIRLSEMLAILRGRALAGLDELNEATLAVLCAGRAEPLTLIERRLIIGERMGGVPARAPAVPLQRDLEAAQKRLRLKVDPDGYELDLDLRQTNDLARSVLFYRLTLLDIPWARPTEQRVQSKGTFHEYWNVRWTPELAIRVIERSIWGATVKTAAVEYVRHAAEHAAKLRDVLRLVDAVMLAELADVTPFVLKRLDALAALTHDIGELMEAVPPLVETVRYGNVRKTDVSLVAPVLEGAVVRSAIGLYAACVQIDDDLAAALKGQLEAVNSALLTADRADLLARWQEALHKLAFSDAAHPLVAGTAARLLYRADKLPSSEVVRLMRLAVAGGGEPAQAAAWLEGFLSGLEQILLRDDAVFGLMDEWLTGLPGEAFDAVLPLLRRTFSAYNAGAKHNLAERVKQGARPEEAITLDEARAARVLPVMRLIVGDVG
jgi:hypothetical protein